MINGKNQASSKEETQNYIDIDKYNQYEEGHPGYQEMMRGVVGATMKSCVACIGELSPKNKGHVLEIGAGTGNFTKRIGAVPNMHINAVEIDDKCVSYLTHKVQSGEIRQTEILQQDFLKMPNDRHEKFHAINTTFTDHHFAPQYKHAFLTAIHDRLQKKGEYILGDEFLPPHNESDPAARVTALIDYHGMVIEEAFKEGKVELPKLELDALLSGLRTTKRFIQQTVEHPPHMRTMAGHTNTYNTDGILHLKEIIARMQKIDLVALPNPENLVPVGSSRLSMKTVPVIRDEFIKQLKALAVDMEQSQRPGIEENLKRKEVGGDYKMTVRQYMRYLTEAGFDAVGYFNGPKPVGRMQETIDNGDLEHPTELNTRDNHAGGVWVIRAMRQEDTGRSPHWLR